MSSRIIRFQVEQINNMVALAVFMFILNISVEQIKFSMQWRLYFKQKLDTHPLN